MTTIYGYPQGSTGIKYNTNEIESLDQTVKIELDDNEINLIGTNVLVNGNPISGGGGGVTNPLTSDLDLNSFDITGVGFGGLNTLNGLNTTVSLQGSNIFNNQNNITDLQNKTQALEVPAAPGVLKVNGLVSTIAVDASSIVQSGYFVSTSPTGINSFQGNTMLNVLSVGTKIFMNNNDIDECKNIDLKSLNINTNDNITLYGNLDFQNVYNLLNIDSINNIRPSGGVFSESSETVYIGGAGVGGLQSIVNQDPTASGSLMIPSNNFKVGDCYSLKIGGKITCGNNDVFEINILSNFGTPSQVVFATINVIVDGAQTNDWFEIECEFIVRAIGGTGKMSTNCHYSYFNSTNVSKGYGIDNIIIFDTQIDNELNVIFGTIDNSILLTVSQVSLTKLY